MMNKDLSGIVVSTERLPMNDGELLPDHFRVFVASDPLPSFDELKKRWGKSKVHRIFDGRPFSLHPAYGDIDPVDGERVFHVHDHGRDWTDIELLAWADKQCNIMAPNGYRPATHVELLAFNKAHPELTDIVALGSFAEDRGNRYVAIVFRYGQKNALDGQYTPSLWSGRVRALLVCK